MLAQKNRGAAKEAMNKKICVLGGTAVDIGGFPFQKLIHSDSNPGSVRISFGGVARNIAVHLAKQQADVSFVGLIGADMYGDQIAADLQKHGVDCKNAIRPDGSETPVYLYINERNGDMNVAVFSSRINDYVTKAAVKPLLPVIRQSDGLFIDTNLSEEVLLQVCRESNVPIFVDPVSTTKARKLHGLFRYIHTMKPNRIEAEVLTGLSIRSVDTAKDAAKKLCSLGVREVFLSMGTDGIVAADSEECIHIPLKEIREDSTTGAGDACMASLILSSFTGESLYERTERSMNYVLSILGRPSGS